MNNKQRSSRYEIAPTGNLKQKRLTEEDRRQLLENDMSIAREKGLCVCRLWQLLLTLNITIIVVTIILIILLLFTIGPLFPYQTYAQSCRTIACNRAHGLICTIQSLCLCPSIDSYWSYNETGCRRCPNGWSMLNGKCIYVSTFSLNWTDAFLYCKSFNGQLLSFSRTKNLSSLTTVDLTSIVSANTNYFIGLTEQPSDSGNWHWVDGSFSFSTSSNLFCTNGSMNQFDPMLRIYMNCGIYRMDSCLARHSCQRTDTNFICEKV